MIAAQCTSWYTPNKRQCTNAAEAAHRWCAEHQAIAERAREAARKKGIDPDAWRHFRYVERGIPWQQGTPGPSDRERAARKFWDSVTRPAADPLRPVQRPLWLPPALCEACRWELGNTPHPASVAWAREVDSYPENDQRRFTGPSRRPTEAEDREYRATLRAIRERCHQAQHMAVEDEAAA